MTVPHQLVHVTQVEGLGEGATANFGTGHNDIARGDHEHAVEMIWIPLANGDPSDPGLVFDAFGDIILILVPAPS